MSSTHNGFESAGAPILVVIADEDVPARVGLRTILSSEPDIEVVAEVGSGWEACALAGELKPDAVVMDVQLAGLGGIEATRRIVATLGSATGVLMVATSAVTECVVQAMAAGASGFLLKPTSRKEIISAVRAAARGKLTAVPPAAQAYAAHEAETVPGPQLIAPLTPRENEVLRLVARGESNRQVAALLGISVETVRTHLKHVYQKTGTRSRLQAGIFVYRSEPMTARPAPRADARS